MTIYSKIYHAIEAFENKPYEDIYIPGQISFRKHASVLVEDQQLARMTEVFIDCAIKLMPDEFQKYTIGYYKSSVKLAEYANEEKVNPKFVQALKNAAGELSNILAGEWTEYSKEEIDKEEFNEKCLLETMFQKEPDSVIFAKKGFNTDAKFYRGLDKKKEALYWNNKVTIVYSPQSERSFIVGRREDVLRVIDEIKTEMQMLSQPRSLMNLSMRVVKKSQLSPTNLARLPKDLNANS